MTSVIPVSACYSINTLERNLNLVLITLLNTLKLLLRIHEISNSIHLLVLRKKNRILKKGKVNWIDDVKHLSRPFLWWSFFSYFLSTKSEPIFHRESHYEKLIIELTKRLNKLGKKSIEIGNISAILYNFINNWHNFSYCGWQTAK